MTQTKIPFFMAFFIFNFIIQGCTTSPKVISQPKEKSLAEQILIIGHRGACGYRPEHTIGSYSLAIDMGADFIEPDLVSTKDGILIARHENEISSTTDVAQKFPLRKKKKVVDGKPIEGWFTEDFTLKEIKSLKAKERLAFRDHSHDGEYQILTFQEIIDFVKKKENEKKRVIGIYPEIKHSTYFASIGLPLEKTFVEILNKNGYTEKTSPIFVQSFEVSNLKALSKMTHVKLLQLFDEPQERPYDFVVKGDPRTYGDLTHPENLKEIATYAQAIGPYKRMIVPENPDKTLAAPTSLIHDAHNVGLLVHPYTFRNEPQYIAPDYHENPLAEYQQFFNLGVDGLFSDFSDTAVKARKQFYGSQKN
ncbi:MAG: glycerophosphodiester phosphodiesterase [Pseudobdellovibrionaceae bacterium]